MAHDDARGSIGGCDPGRMPDDYVDSFGEAAGDDLLVEFVNLDREKKQLEKRIEEIKERKQQIQSVLIDEWTNRGIKHVSLNGRTVAIVNNFICAKKAGVTTEQICDVLRTVGFGDLVKTKHYESGALKALIREIENDDDKEIPPELEPLIHHYIEPSLRATASG